MSISHEEVIAKFTSGNPITVISKEYGVSRQRVQQILKKHGLGKNEGGAKIRAILECGSKEEKKQQEAKEKDLRYMNKYGCSFDGYKKIPQEAKLAYVHQRKNASRRGIGWAFTLYTWWETWDKSGFWKERGRGYGYCMARKNDVGIYSPENVYICTQVENMQDYYKTDLYKARKKSLMDVNLSV